MASLGITGVTKSYGDQQVIHGVDLDITDGEFVVFVGPSGCGKSTLLRMIAGLEEISGGEIEIAGRVVNEVAPAKRGVAMVFQTYALYPHMTVYNNMAFGLRQARTPPDEIDRRVRGAADVLNITDYLDRLPRALSGGQRQRVAIGRAIVREPAVFLFDEPLSNLDAALRVRTRLEIARLHERLGATMIYVTHDQVEAMTLADKIVVLRDGRIEQVGTPIALYETPANTFVAGFIGSPQMNFFSMTDLVIMAPEEVTQLGIRPEHLFVVPAGEGVVEARLELVEHLGEYALAHMISTGGTEFVVKLESPPDCAKGGRMSFSAAPDRIHLFGNDGLRIAGKS
ncbi:MAG: ABC transporter ATP-binding protein [Paracoccaceae bacterium]